MDSGECPLRCYYRRVYDLLCAFHSLSPSCFGEKSNLIPGLQWQLSRYDNTIKQTRIIVQKIIRLTIETGSLTGA